MKTAPFQGTRVFMSRNLVPPELFDMLHDVLKQNGAQIFLCCDPSMNGPSDYHVISSSDHEKFEDLRAKGCKLVGPQCVVSCAKERRPLPQQGYTCCLAMDGAKVLASGFEMIEKAEIEKLVTAMGGILPNKTSPDISFIIAKNVLAAKYKWALNVLKKPVVTINWLYQCHNEHRVVPQESYRVLPFTGLTICVTRISADERKEIQKHIMQNGGKYSAELTKKCTHLISDQAPEGDKYKVAKRWGHIHIVTRKWFDQSISRRACLNEESYPVQGSSISSVKPATSQQNQDRVIRHSQSAPSTAHGDQNLYSVPATDNADPELEATLSQNISSMSTDSHVLVKEDHEVPALQSNAEINHDGHVADDSETEDNDLYLSECRLTIIGFESSELRNLVNMVRRGGASRYTTLNERLTHIILGLPSESEKKEVRTLSSMGHVNVVRRNWLEDCDRERKEIPVLPKHIAHDLLLPKGSMCFSKVSAVGTASVNHNGNTAALQGNSSDPPLRSSNGQVGILHDKRVQKPIVRISGLNNLEDVSKSLEQNFSPSDENKVKKKMQSNCSTQNGRPSGVFKGRTFCFSETFPEDRRDEIVEWVNQGGGLLVGDHETQIVHFVIECHGIKRRSDISQIVYVSSHWIRSCLEDGCLLDVGSHLLYSPLPCRVPFPGFSSMRFCVSQYEEKDRILLRNLCFTLGAKFIEKLTKKVTHLLCKFTSGPKYEAACKWGIKSVTSDWIYECVRQNKIVSLDPFCPREVSAQEAGSCMTSQFPSQAVQTSLADHPSQFSSQSQDLRNSQNQTISNSFRDEVGNSRLSKKARVTEDNCPKYPPSSRSHMSYSISNVDPNESAKVNGSEEVIDAVPDVAAAIEDLLAQTSKIHDLKSPERTTCDRSVPFLSGQERPEPPALVGLSKHWINRSQKNDGICNPSGTPSTIDGFSETQTDSQVVGYEEDLSGRQMIIDRVRTQSSMG